MGFNENIAAAARIAGLDTETGLQHFAGKAVLYDKGLGLMNKKVFASVETARGFLAEENWNELGLQAHGLKGSLANLGAVHLSDAALELERAGKNGDGTFIKAHLGTFLTELEAFGKELAAIYGGKAPADNPLVKFKPIIDAADAFDYAAVYSEADMLDQTETDPKVKEALAGIKKLAEDYELTAIEDFIKQRFS